LILCHRLHILPWTVETTSDDRTHHPDKPHQSDEYDDSVPPLWQSVIDLGASLPPEVWDRVPNDLAANLDHYLYGSVGEDE
jgi:hypothetical protein